jgi:hypothetical protein
MSSDVSQCSGSRDWFDVEDRDSITYRGLWDGRIVTWSISSNRELDLGPRGINVGGVFHSYESVRRIAASLTPPITTGWTNAILQYIGRGLIQENSDEFEIPFPDQGSVRINTVGERNSHLRIGGINGVSTSWNDAFAHAQYIDRKHIATTLLITRARETLFPLTNRRVFMACISEDW